MDNNVPAQSGVSQDEPVVGPPQAQALIQPDAVTVVASPEEAPAQPNVAEPTISSPPMPKSKKPLIIVLALLSILIVAGAIAAVYFLVMKKDGAPQPQQVDNAVIESEIFGVPEQTISNTASGFEYITPKFLDLNVTWQKPTKISPLGFFKNERQAPDTQPEDQSDQPIRYVNYYLAGTFASGKIVYVDLPFDGPGSALEVFLVRDGQKAEVLSRYQYATANRNADTESTLMGYTDNAVAFNIDTVIKGTWAPDTIRINNQRMALPRYPLGDGSGGDYSNNTGSYVLSYDPYVDSTRTMVGTAPEGTIYEVSRQKEGYRLTLYELEMPNGFRASYVLDGEISGADVQPITWTDGTRNLDQYENFGYGCGGANYALVVDLPIAQLQQIGKTDGGQTIYGFTDLNGVVAKQLISEVSSRDGQTPITTDVFTPEEFRSTRAVILFEDAMGRIIAFKNSKYYVSGGCAKPVVYLYPTVPTTLDVRVGANVTISDPLYEADGWTDVRAFPNGTMHYRGQAYESLFWEGQGYGEYPDTSSRGIVVARQSVVATLYDHLAQQGFNRAETDDFIEFWEVNLPDKPYVRITWLNTAEMNELAPLYLSVKPDTLIRTFVELEGLDEPRLLTPQVFTAPKRVGFTVTEWGGLAINGLDQLNYPITYPYKISLPTTL